MDDPENRTAGTRRARLLGRLARRKPRRSDEASAPRAETRRASTARVEVPLAWDPIVPATKTWEEVGGFASAGGEHIQLAASRAEPGGVPVFVDPAMVSPATAERMRPLFRR
jgi:hypothetical protein